MATSFDDFDDFLAEIDSEIASLELPPPKPRTKTVNCFMCKGTYNVPVPYRLSETCPDCYMKFRKHHGLEGPNWPPVERK